MSVSSWLCLVLCERVMFLFTGLTVLLVHLRAPPRWPSGKASASRAEGPGFESRCAGIFSGSSHTCDLNLGTPVATLPGSWRYRVSAGTGGPGVSILWVGEMESLICSFYLSVAAGKIVWADPSLRYTRMLLGRWASNQPTNKQTPQSCVCLQLTLHSALSASFVSLHLTEWLLLRLILCVCLQLTLCGGCLCVMLLFNWLSVLLLRVILCVRLQPTLCGALLCFSSLNWVCCFYVSELCLSLTWRVVSLRGVLHCSPNDWVCCFHVSKLCLYLSDWVWCFFHRECAPLQLIWWTVFTPHNCVCIQLTGCVAFKSQSCDCM